MNIHHLSLTNFRCFAHQELDFHLPFTLLLGDNGSGKTALMEALRVVLGAFLLGVEAVRAPGMSQTDIRERITPDDLGSVTEPPQIETFSPIEMGARGEIEGRAVQWTLRRKQGGQRTSGQVEQLTDVVRELVRKRKEGDTPILPLLAYYPAKRLTQSRVDPIERAFPPARWERGYEQAFDATLRQGTLLRWIRSTTYSELQQRKESPLLASVLRAVAHCLDGYSRIFYSVQLEELVAVDEFGRQHRVRLLSEGYWTMLIMALDIAFRCAILNPHLGYEVLDRTPGVVLIDELDLHLHPRWQQRVVSDLMRAFPKIQFIATTHSPIIGASLPSSCLYHLEIDEEGWSRARQYSENTLGLSSDQMLSGSYFDLVSDRSQEAQIEFEKLAERVGQGDSDAALAFLQKLNTGFEGDKRG